MHLCIFNPEHDLCMAKGRANYVPPRSAVDFAKRDAATMQVLYPDAVCCSAYEVAQTISRMGEPSTVTAWGWNSTVKHQLTRQGISPTLLPSDATIATIRELQHRSTVLPLQRGSIEITSVEAMEGMLRTRSEWVMKAPWSGAGRGLRWVHGRLTEIDRNWIVKVVADQRCVIAEPKLDVRFNVGLEYLLRNAEIEYMGYSLFTTRHGVYQGGTPMPSDGANPLELPSFRQEKAHVEEWLRRHIVPRYEGPLGVDMMVSTQGGTCVAEVNFRHTMGMVDCARREGRWVL